MKWLLVVCILGNIQSYSQIDINAALKSLVEAERAFSRMSSELNTRSAFLHFFAPDAIENIDGKETMAINRLKAREADSSLLVWEPVYADISSSGDFGYTTGPYKYYKSRKDTIAKATGYYSSVWQRQKNGEWKVVFDLGGAVVEPIVPRFKTPSVLLHPYSATMNMQVELEGLLDFDQKYIHDLENRNKTFIASYFQEEARLHRPGVVPIVGKAAIDRHIDPSDRKFKLEQLGGRMAGSADMAFTYGNVVIQNVKDPSTPNRLLRYFRIYKKDRGEWKIVFDLIA